jgi:single-stranded DNA-binding protein
MSKENNYDRTAAQRMRKRDQRIKDADLSNLKIVMFKDDAEKVREYAKKLYEKRGLSLS